MKTKLKFNLWECPSEISEHIVDLCVEHRIAQLSKQSVRLLIVLGQTSWMFRLRILELSKGWMRFVKNKDCVNLEMQQDWFSLTHYLLRRCFHCNKLSYREVTRDTFNMMLHKDCIMTLTETVWFFDYRMVHRKRVQDRLGPMLCAVIDYHMLTPQRIREHLPHGDCEGKNQMMGRYVYQRFFVEPNHLVPEEHTLFGWLNLTRGRLEHIRFWYTHKQNGYYLVDIPKFPRLYRKMVKYGDVSRKRNRV